jgi:hypothetical protein
LIVLVGSIKVQVVVADRLMLWCRPRIWIASVKVGDMLHNHWFLVMQIHHLVLLNLIPMHVWNSDIVDLVAWSASAHAGHVVLLNHHSIIHEPILFWKCLTPDIEVFYTVSGLLKRMVLHLLQHLLGGLFA